MRVPSIAALLVALFVSASFAFSPFKTDMETQAVIYDNQAYVNANKLLMLTSNSGNFAYDATRMFGKYDGLYFPYVSIADIMSGAADKTVMFDAGLWIGAIDSATGDTLVTVAEYSTEFGPGRMVNHAYDPGAATDPAVKVYKLYSDSQASNPNADYLNWPSSQGAPFDTLGRPKMLGDQMTWCVFNDANPSRHNNAAGSKAPLGLEIQQTTYAFKSTDLLSRCIFLNYKVFNRGTNRLNSVYVSLWADPDVGQPTDDLQGCDTNLSLGYSYNGTNSDGVYGSKPPAVGFIILQGPLQSTGNQSNVGTMWGNHYHGYRNLLMTSFRKIINGTDPTSADQSYRNMTGLNVDGEGYSYNGQYTKFMVSGDPTSATGDVDFSPSDRRMMVSTGPLTLRPNDSSEIVAAVVVGQGSDRLNAIWDMKYRAQLARQTWETISGMPCCVGKRGDTDEDGVIDISDIQAMVDYLFMGQPITSCSEARDVDGSGAEDIADLVKLIDFVFFGTVLSDCP